MLHPTRRWPLTTSARILIIHVSADCTPIFSSINHTILLFALHLYIVYRTKLIQPIADTIVHNSHVLFATYCSLSCNQIAQWFTNIAVW